MRNLSLAVLVALLALLALPPTTHAQEGDRARSASAGRRLADPVDEEVVTAEASVEAERTLPPLEGPIVLTLSAATVTGVGIVASGIGLGIDYCQSTSPGYRIFCGGSGAMSATTAWIVGATSLSLAGTISSAVWWAVNNRARRSAQGEVDVAVVPMLSIAPGEDATAPSAVTAGLSVGGSF